MKVSTKNIIPKYQRIIKQKVAPALPLSSRRGMRGLYKIMDQLRPALEQIDFGSPTIKGLKSRKFNLAASQKRVIDYILGLFDGLPNWAHPLTQKNLMPPTTAVSVVTAFLTALFNPDICSIEFSGKSITKAEEKIVELLSKIVGYDPRFSFGFYTYGGTLTIYYGILLGLERAFPGRYLNGQEGKVKVLCSDAAHFSVRSALGLMGVGTKNLVQIETNESEEMSLHDLERKGEEILRRGEKIACIVATLGTTDAFGLDDLAGIVRIRDGWISKFGIDYPISIHADAVVGWAWGFFRNYDFDVNPLQFPRETLEAIRKIVEKIRHLDRVDTIGLNPHKYGYAPIPASFVLFKGDGKELAPFKHHREKMRQLYNVASWHPGAYTIETTRFAGGVLSTLANLMFLGEQGYQAILGRIVEMGILLRQQLAEIDGINLINQQGLGGGTIFYFSKPGQSILEQNTLNKKILRNLLVENEGFPINVSSTLSSDGRIVIKSLIMSPLIDAEDVALVCEAVRKAAQKALG